jgi:ubiquinone/menaquinone biosynthesis C-methylase UbiE
MNLWDRYAQSYDMVLEKVFFYRELHDDVAAKIKGCQKIVDIGTGTGNFLAKATNPYKFGVDNNDSMLRYASRKLKYGTLSKQEIEFLGFKSDSVDAVICINVLYTSEQPMQALKEMHRVLRQGGILALSGPLPSPDFELLKKRAVETLPAGDIAPHIAVVEECSRQILATSIRNKFTAPQLEEILKNEIGFSIILESHHRYYLAQNYFLLARK